MTAQPRPPEPAPGRDRAAPWTLVGLAGTVVLVVALFGTPAAVTALAVVIQLVFLAFFLRHLAFAIAAFRNAPGDLAAPVVDTGYRPSVTVLVACKDEATVVERLVESLVALDYPSDRLECLVVDDGSTDGTGELLDAVTAGTEVRCVHRPPASGGGKAGALNAGLALASGEVTIVFDADHRPRPDVVARLVRHFADPAVAAVQGRCEIGNPDDAPITQLVAIDYLAGYLVNEYGRQAMFGLPAYGGANCAVRTSALVELGGWNTASVTEDTDLTLRVLLSGRRVRYDVTAVDVEEGVTTLGRYWRQRYRWARGHQQAWRDFRRPVWRSRRLSPAEKAETTMFLLAFHLPVISAVGLVLALSWLSGLATPPVPIDLFILWMLLFLGPLLELGGGLLLARADRRWAMALFYFLPLFLVSVVLCTKAWVDGLLGRRYTWAKTPRAAELDEVALEAATESEARPGRPRALTGPARPGRSPAGAPRRALRGK